MLNEFRSAMRWIVSLSHRLLNVVPWFTVSSVASTLVSQLALLLAFVLPLKVILLLGSEGVPHYFPEQFKTFDRQTLILGLSGLAIALFFVHLLAERFIEASVAGGSRKLLLHSRKMELFENQDEIAARAYQRFSRGFASLVFLSLFGPLLFALSPYLGMLFFGYVLAATAGCLLLAAFNDEFRARLGSGGTNLPTLLAGVGFLLCFSYMVAEFLWLKAPSVLVAVICLLLTRQLLRHVVNVVNHTVAVVERRRQLSALFFHGHRLMEPPRHGLEGVWMLAEPEARGRWLHQALAELLGGPVSIRSAQWLQLGISDVLVYRVGATYGAAERMFIVKVFERNRRSAAKHEATLLVNQAGLPALEFIGVTDLADQFHCHVFAFDDMHSVTGAKLAGCCESARSELLACDPDRELKAIYVRSKSTLAQRLGRDVLERLYHLIDRPDQCLALKRFDETFDDIKALLGTLPLGYVNPDIRRGPLFRDGKGQVFVGHWVRWSLEPVGCGWPVDKRGLNSLLEAHVSTVARRADMAEISAPHLKLAAQLFAFEKSCKQQNYQDAAELLAGINEAFDEIQVQLVGQRKTELSS
ncbi:hypothetical protein CH92_13895 [Stutzerimonas stutzeri]|uniref:Uncharacterized protein n=2 Tax=Stutzerimonas stutzeri TaxID=316 RepID=W8R0K9_STUST|nr:hypothetical protein CH92_13895 [Stutzerimonas stutzeri]